MKIDVFFGVYPHPAKPYFEAQLAEWRRQGHHLRLFSLGQIPGATSEFPIQHIRTLEQRPIQLIAKILWRVLSRPIRCLRVIRGESGSRQVLKRLATDVQLPSNAPDVYFIHGIAPAVHFSYLREAAPQTTLAIYYHGGEIPGVRQIPFEESSRALRRAHVVFSNTQASVDDVVARGACPERTVRVPVGLPLERFESTADRTYHPDSIWRFVCIGRMAPEKGFDVALRAFSALKKLRNDFHLTLIGGGPELQNLGALADRLHLHDTVRFLQHVNSKRLISMLEQFDVLILPSVQIAGNNWRETQAVVMQEAMLMGVCVIASDIGGVRESLPSILHPYLYTAGSSAELLSRLMAMMSCDAGTLHSFARVARRFVHENYDIRSVNSELIAKLQRY